mmetsp:Transcript_46483/g.105541  ORF Transcript_46483/g.105541 Transcript_46483/m.105541 type:complete len:269 (-) Transcript_46483:1594-2400(-)
MVSRSPVPAMIIPTDRAKTARQVSTVYLSSPTSGVGNDAALAWLHVENLVSRNSVRWRDTTCRACRFAVPAYFNPMARHAPATRLASAWRTSNQSRSSPRPPASLCAVGSRPPRSSEWMKAGTCSWTHSRDGSTESHKMRLLASRRIMHRSGRTKSSWNVFCGMTILVATASELDRRCISASATHPAWPVIAVLITSPFDNTGPRTPASPPAARSRRDVPDADPGKRISLPPWISRNNRLSSFRSANPGASDPTPRHTRPRPKPQAKA